MFKYIYRVHTKYRQRPEESIRSPGIGVTVVVSCHVGAGSRVRQDQQMLLTAELCLQPLYEVLFY